MHHHSPTESALPPLPAAKGEWWARIGASAIFVAAVCVTLYGVHTMGAGMKMPGGWTMPMMWMVMPSQTLIAAATMFLIMWQAMMIAMMLPSTLPMLMLYRRVAEFRGLPRPWLCTSLVGTGYFLVWLAFGGVAFAMGYFISRWAMTSFAASRAIPVGAGVALILAGVYQLTPLKQMCLRHCREPVLYLSEQWRPGVKAAIGLGVHHGAFCAACCWALMLVQMLLGIMNLGVMIAVAAVIAAEKLWKRGPSFARLVGACTIIIGAAIIWSSRAVPFVP